MGRALGSGFGLTVGVGLGVDVGVAVGVAVAVAVAVGVDVEVAVAVAVGVKVAVAVAVAVGVAVGVVSVPSGAWIWTEIGEPVLKNPMFAVVATGGPLESKRKLYNVAKRTAFAFWFWANVSQFQVTVPTPCVNVHGWLL